MRWWLTACLSLPLWGHEIITTRISWAREVSRIVHQRCASCHRAGGAAPFALLTYDDARPWARAIAEEVLERRMPPWNPVKGYGEFKHEAGLSQEEIGLIADWVEGGAPRGEDRYLPAVPTAWLPVPRVAGTRVRVVDGMTLPRAVAAMGIAVELREGAGLSVWAELPDGATEPLLQIARFRQSANQPYEFASRQLLPAGTRMRVEGAAAVMLISSGAAPARRTAPSGLGPPVVPGARRGGARAGER